MVKIAVVVGSTRPGRRSRHATISQFDGFVFVTAEYNHSVPGVLKNALDYLYAEWNNKAAGFVSYGGAGGVRAISWSAALQTVRT